MRRGQCLDSGAGSSKITTVDAGETTSSADQPEANRSPESTRNTLATYTQLPDDPTLVGLIEKSLTPGFGKYIQRVNIVKVHDLVRPYWHDGDRRAPDPNIRSYLIWY